MSMLIMIRSSAGTFERFTDPFVSRTTCFPDSANIFRRSGVSGWSMGSPPVTHTRGKSPEAERISCGVIS